MSSLIQKLDSLAGKSPDEIVAAIKYPGTYTPSFDDLFPSELNGRYGYIRFKGNDAYSIDEYDLDPNAEWYEWAAPGAGHRNVGEGHLWRAEEAWLHVSHNRHQRDQSDYTFVLAPEGEKCRCDFCS